jgi:hypothetical protein
VGQWPPLEFHNLQLTPWHGKASFEVRPGRWKKVFLTAHSQGRLPWLSFLKGPRARLKGSCNIDTQIRPRLREAWDDGPIPCSPRPRRQKVQDCGNLRILQIGPKSSKCTVSIQHVRKTWGQLRPARPQLRPNLDPLGPNFGPAWLQDVAAGPQVGHIWE